MTILEFFRRAFNINPKEVKIVEVTNNTIEKKVIKEEVIEPPQEIKVKKLGKLAQRRLRQQK